MIQFIIHISLSCWCIISINIIIIIILYIKYIHFPHHSGVAFLTLNIFIRPTVSYFYWLLLEVTLSEIFLNYKAFVSNNYYAKV